MAGITLQQAEDKLAYWLNIEEQLGINAEVTIDNKTFKRHQLKDISAMITTWEARVSRLSRSGGIRVMEAIPR
jgi:hypothetical protein